MEFIETLEISRQKDTIKYLKRAGRENQLIQITSETPRAKKTIEKNETLSFAYIKDVNETRSFILRKQFRVKMFVKLFLLIAVVFVVVAGDEYPEVDAINKCEHTFERVCAVNNYGYAFWYASDCLLKYRNFWERTHNPNWNLSKY